MKAAKYRDRLPLLYTISAKRNMGTDNINQSSGLEAASRHIQTASIVIYCLIIIVGTLGNGLVIYVTGFKMQKTVDSVWFLSLAIADFLFTAFLIFSVISLSQNHQWPFGAFMCRLNNFVSVVNMFASIFTLTAMSLDRCLSIWMVVWAHNKRTVCKAQLISACIWVTAAVCSTPYATFRTVLKHNGSRFCGYPTNMTGEQKWILYTFRFVMGFVIPFLVIFVSYVAIGIRAMRMPRTRKPRSRRIIFAIIFAFFICWLPFHVFNFIELKSNPDIPKIWGPLTVCLAFLNSCLNPILYVFMCEEFQKKLRQSICFVLESALAEDHVSSMSPRSMSSNMSKASQKSDTAATSESPVAFESFPESRVVITEETPSTE